MIAESLIDHKTGINPCLIVQDPCAEMIVHQNHLDQGIKRSKVVSTLESGINIAIRLIIFRLLSRGYGLIPDSIA